MLSSCVCMSAAIFDEVNRLSDDTMLNSITSPCALLYIVMLTAVRWNLVHLCSIGTLFTSVSVHHHGLGGPEPM